MNAPQRIQRRRTKGWRMPENTIYVGRGSKWGNPYRVEASNGEYSTINDAGTSRSLRMREADALMMVVSWFSESIANGWNGVPGVGEIRSELAGKNLACWCPADQPCHADVLLELANQEKP